MGIDTLRGIAAVTGEPVNNLERMVLGRAAPAVISDDLAAEIEERVRRAIREELAVYLGDRQVS